MQRVLSISIINLPLCFLPSSAELEESRVGPASLSRRPGGGLPWCTHSPWTGYLGTTVHPIELCLNMLVLIADNEVLFCFVFQLLGSCTVTQLVSTAPTACQF